MTLNEHIEGLEHSIAERSWSFGMDYIDRQNMEHDKEVLAFLKELKRIKKKVRQENSIYHDAYKMACRELGYAYADKGRSTEFWNNYFLQKLREEE